MTQGQKVSLLAAVVVFVLALGVWLVPVQATTYAGSYNCGRSFMPDEDRWSADGFRGALDADAGLDNNFRLNAGPADVCPSATSGRRATGGVLVTVALVVGVGGWLTFASPTARRSPPGQPRTAPGRG